MTFTTTVLFLTCLLIGAMIIYIGYIWNKVSENIDERCKRIQKKQGPNCYSRPYWTGISLPGDMADVIKDGGRIVEQVLSGFRLDFRVLRFDPERLSYASGLFQSETSPDSEHYKALGLNVSASQEEIRKAFIRLMKIHHPDKNGGKLTFRARQITQAYGTLTAN